MTIDPIGRLLHLTGHTPRAVLVAAAAAALLPAAVHAQDDGPLMASASRDEAIVERPSLEAAERSGEIVLDGVLDEDAWEAAQPYSGFIQQRPVEGAPAEEDTEVRVLFDEEAVWIGARLFDSEPDEIVDRLVRRDSHGQFDMFMVELDPNLDRLTGYIFTVNAANVQGDGYFYDDRRMDGAWDAVWASEVKLHEGGWTVEMRIPLSQIRYEASEEPQTWGINFRRQRIASNETTYFSLVSQLREGIVSQMGTLEGVHVERPSRRLEALPYVVSSLHTGPSTDGDPFFDGSSTGGRVGVDLSYGLGAAFTLDAAINPDFGQVEADPAVINLSAFETFFQERRPFFVEDARIFDFGLSGHRNQLFYSRRIGRSPHGGAPSGTTFEDVPDNATILGAAKLAGRTTGGLSIGAMAAVTDAEEGRGLFSETGQVEKFLVEPRSEFGVVSLQQDFNEGTSQVRGIVSAMRRDLPGDESFDFLTSSSVNAGLRFEHQWNDREWALWGFFAGSHVRGSERAIQRIQRASNHYFQRPDATRLEVDSTATSLTGAEWRLQFERRSGEHWTGAIWAAEVTKGFEINDVGFSQTAERLDGGARIAYREIVPGDLFRSYDISFSNYHNWSHEALDDAFSLDSWHNARLRGSYNLRANAQFLNYWRVRGNVSYSPRAMSRSATRGGPMMVDPGSTRYSLNIDSDSRKDVSYGLDLELRDDHQGIGGQRQIRGQIRIRPSDNLQLSLHPSFEIRKSSTQYVTATDVLTWEPTFGTRYVFSDLERRSFSMVTRLDWTFSPTLSLQLFAQPLLSSGDFLGYKQLEASQSFDFIRFREGTAGEVDGQVICSGGSICEVDGRQHVDFDGDGAADYSFADRDFNVRSLVGNAVLRWEYRPGSTVFLVWQRRQVGRASTGDFDFNRDARALFDAPADNRFIIKVNYWLGL